MRLVGALLCVAACQGESRQATPKGPAAACGQVAETLTSIELGNYASRDARAPTVDRHRAACTAAAVTKDEATCLDKATDTWTAAACVPRMFPNVKMSGDCKQVVVRMREAITKQMGDNPKSLAMVDKMLPAIQTSCDEDRWPASLKGCIIAAEPGDMEAVQLCTNSLSPELQDKLSKRMMQHTEP